MFLIFDMISGILTGVVGLMIMVVIVPVVVQILIHMVINMINSTLKTNIRPMLNLIFFPGALIRVTFLFLVLSLMGWKPNITYGRLAGLQNPTSTNNSHFSGFAVFMKPPRRGISLGHTIIISLSGYFVWAWVLLYVRFQQFITQYMAYLWGSNTANIVYVVVLLSLVIGGMPIPEETMLPLYYIVAYYPHLVISAMLGFIGAAITGGLFGITFGRIYYIVFLAMITTRHLTHKKQLDMIDRRDGITIDIEEVILF